MKTLLSLIVGLFMVLPMSAQVGVNEPNPEQALDVNGKVKITDDAKDPTAGTMRFNKFETDFEGYDGKLWNSFTKSPSSAGTSSLPSNPVPVFGYGLKFSSNSSIVSTTFKRWTDGSTFTQVPTGKFLIVTSIRYFTPVEPIDEVIFKITVGPAPSSTNLPSIEDGALFLYGIALNTNIDNDTAQSPVFILRPGEYLNFTNLKSSQVILQFRGFLVDDLNY